MKFCFINYMYLYTTLVLIHLSNSTSILQPMNREVRFSKFVVNYPNNATGKTLECGIKLYKNKHILFLRTVLYHKINQFNAKFSVLKCKEYYIDCVNVVSYDVNNVCEKLSVLTHFSVIEVTNETVNKCPVFGEYNYKHISIDGDKFGSAFSLPAEKWWEYYWRMKIILINAEVPESAVAVMDYYFIQYRRRDRQH